MPNQVAPPRRHRRGASPEIKQSKTQPRPRLGRRGSVIHVLISARTTGHGAAVRTPGRQPPRRRRPRLGDPALGTCPTAHLAPRARAAAGCARGVHGGEAKPATALTKPDYLRWSPRHITPKLFEIASAGADFRRANYQVRILQSALGTPHVWCQNLFLPAEQSFTEVVAKAGSCTVLACLPSKPCQEVSCLVRPA